MWEKTDGEEMPGGQQHYKIFSSKNNRSSAPANGSARSAARSVIPLLNTPRLSNPERDVICGKCRSRCKSLKCSQCGALTHSKRISPLTYPSYKPVRGRTAATATRPAPGIACVDVDISDDEDPIPVPGVSHNGSVFVTTPAVTITPVRPPVTLLGQQLYLGSMSAVADVTVTGEDFQLRSLSLRNQIRGEKYNIVIPHSDCKVFYFSGADSSHVDKAVFVFIKMQHKPANDLMAKLSVHFANWSSYRLDPKDPDEKFSLRGLQIIPQS